MIYTWIKVFHVLGAVILFGTALTTAIYNLFANRTKDVSLIADATKKVVYADWLFTGTAAVFQPVTGLAMVMIKGYSILTFWIIGSIAGYFLTAICWVPVVQFQIKLRDIAKQANEQNTPLPPLYDKYYKRWFVLVSPAFISLLCVFFLMSNRPESLTVFLHQLMLAK